MEQAASVHIELLKELGQSNRALSSTLKTALQLAESHQLQSEKLQPIAIEIYTHLSSKEEWTKEEEHWHRTLKAALTGQTD